MIIQCIRDILVGRQLVVIAPTATARDACIKLREADAGALAVMREDRLVGILSEHDVIRKCIAGGRRTDETRVADIMTPDPVTVDADAKLADALKSMIAGGFRHMPVTSAGRVLGLLSMRDIPTDYRLMFERFAEYRRVPQVPTQTAAAV